MGKKIKPKALKLPKTVQESIPFERVYPENGIIETEPGQFCHAYRLGAVNFSCAKDADAMDMFLRFGELLNSLDVSTQAQIVIQNHSISKSEFEESVLLKYEKDGLDPLREEMNTMLREKMSEGRNNLTTDIYFIVSIEAESAAEATMQFSRMDGEITSLVGRIGNSTCEVLTTTDMLRVLFDIYNRGHEDEFGAKTQLDGTGHEMIDYHQLLRLGLSVKDIIGPDSMEFRPGYFRLGEGYGRIEYLSQLPSQLSVAFYPELCGLGFPMLSSIHYQPLPQEEALRRVKNQLTSVNSNVVDAQKRAARAGYSGELISAELKNNAQEANSLLEDLQTRNQKMFEVTLTLAHFADSMEELDQQTEAIQSCARKYLVSLSTMTFQQEPGLSTTLPLARLDVAVKRTLTTETASVFIPYSVQESSARGGLYYGTNAISHNLVIADRKKEKNGNGWVFGTPGSGKSYAVKAEIIQCLLQTNDDVLICDPEREFFPIAAQLNRMSTTGKIAKVERIALGSKNYINPLDLPEFDEDDDEDPMGAQLTYILSLVQNMYSAHYPLPQGADSLIDRAMKTIYRPYLQSKAAGRPDPRLMPTLRDLQSVLMSYPEPVAKEIALSMEVYCKGSLDLFAHQTVVREGDDNARVTIFDTKDTGASLKSLSMLVVTNTIWNRLCQNRLRGKNTWVVLDEVYLLFQERNSAEFLRTLWKRARKYNGILSAITQNVEDLLLNDTVRSMLSNSEFILMLNQSPLDRASLSSILSLSESQLSYISNAEAGAGLLKVGAKVIPFKNRYPKDSQLNRIMNTNLREMSEEDLALLEADRKATS